MNKETSIILVNWNGLCHLKTCLEALQKQTYQDFEIIVVDNASTDGSVEVLEKEYSQIKLIKNQKNLGYGKGQNIGIKIAQGKYILTFEFDIILENTFLEEIVKAIGANPKIGSVTGKLLKLVQGKKTNIIDTTGHILLKNREAKNRGEGQKNVGQYDQPEYIFGVSAAAALYRKEMFEDIKYEDEYFDEDFIAYYDDVDVDWRAQSHGWKAFYQPTAIAYHVRGGSTPSSKIHYLVFRNRWLMRTKNDSLLNILRDFPYILTSDLIRTSEIIINPFLWKVIRDYFKLLPKLLKKRHFYKEKKKINDFAIRKWFSRDKDLYLMFIYLILLTVLIIAPIYFWGWKIFALIFIGYSILRFFLEIIWSRLTTKK